MARAADHEQLAIMLRRSGATMTLIGPEEFTAIRALLSRTLTEAWKELGR